MQAFLASSCVAYSFLQDRYHWKDLDKDAPFDGFDWPTAGAQTYALELHAAGKLVDHNHKFEKENRYASLVLTTWASDVMFGFVRGRQRMETKYALLLYLKVLISLAAVPELGATPLDILSSMCLTQGF